MNLQEEKYTKFNLCKEMLETADIIANFDPSVTDSMVKALSKFSNILLTGEGSSRIFPTKHAIYREKIAGSATSYSTEGSTQALEYALANSGVLGLSNSGKTKELVRLFKKLESEKHPAFFGITSMAKSTIEEIAHETRVLACGKEAAVAATKSVAEQALTVQAITYGIRGKKLTGLKQAGELVRKVLTATIDPKITKACAQAEKLYFAGRNNGVAEELTLKTNEITRKTSSFLEGTYAVHGIEEVMNANEALIIVNPFPDEEEKFETCLSKGVGMTVVAIAPRQTRFPTIIIPELADFDSYLELAAGWNLLVEIGVLNNIAIDTPLRARKVGNEYTGK